MTLPLLWAQCRDAFLQEVHTTHTGSASTLRGYASILKNFFIHSGKSPERCTRQDVVAFMGRPTIRRRNKGKEPAPATRNQRLVIIHRFYDFASHYTVYDGYGNPYKLFQGENPAANLHQVAVETRPRYLTEQEVIAFFAAIDRDTLVGKRDYALFLTLFLTARRRKEIADLLWGDIEWGDVTDEQGNRQAWRYHFRGKGKGGQDDIAELPEPAHAAIMAWLEASGRLPLEPDDPIFTAVGSPTGGMPTDPYKRLSDTAIWFAVKRYAERAGINPNRVTVHGWRHTSAKHRLDLGQDFIAINKLMRHKSLDMTKRYTESLQVVSDPGAALLMEKFSGL